MFYPLPYHQLVALRRDFKAMLFQAFILMPALILMLAWVIWWGDSIAGSPSNDLTRTFLGDSFKLLAFIQAYLVALMAFPALLCTLSDPAGTRLAMWALAASVFTLITRVLCLIDALGVRLNAQPIPAVPSGLRYTVRVRPSIPELRFTAGVSPQLE